MKDFPLLYQRLKQYSQTDFYPFHMPGHKRQMYFPDIYHMDITEIDGFDNLHHPEGILKESMEWAASVYGAVKTYYLVNGSSCGILSAVSGVIPDGGTILMSRNCHKAAYHGVFLKSLRAVYVYPQFEEEYGIQCGLPPEKIRFMLKRDRDVSAVFIVSPTYDGIVSDIRSISEVCHEYNVPLIVDEAHGAHFRYGDIFPVSALELGADVVIQSVHKTLPCFTQSALLHLRGDYVDRECVEKYLQIYQSSSPSYVLMAGIERGIWWLEQTEGKERMKEFSSRLLELRSCLKEMKHLKLLGRELAGTKDIYDVDISKIIISTRGTGISGVRLCDRLRERYHLEMEMCAEDYVTAITTVMDTEEGFNRLRNALLEIDAAVKSEPAEFGPAEFGPAKSNPAEFESTASKKIRPRAQLSDIWQAWPDVTDAITTIHEAWNRPQESVLLRESAGRIAGEFVYLYPPGIPVIAPGERITEKIVDTIMRYKEIGLPVQGMKDLRAESISVL